jgi:hypothetical protein
LRYIIYSIKIRLFCGIFSTIFDIFTHNKTEVFSQTDVSTNFSKTKQWK